MQFDSIVRGGTVVTPMGRTKCDIGIRGEKIAAIADKLACPGANVINARGHLVLPGVIDVHVHLDLPLGPNASTSDDFRTGTRAGARGGVTTLIDFATPHPKRNGKYESLAECVDHWHAKAEGKALIDYAFHVCITKWEQHKSEVAAMIREGFPTFKEYMIYAERGMQSGDRDLFCTLEAMRDLGGMLMVHAENSPVLAELIERFHTPTLMKKYGARLHTMTRPHFIEAEAIQRAVMWSDATGGPLYIVHMSTGWGADIVRDAQANGVPILAETCTQYLVLDDSVFGRKNGHLYASQPQLKRPHDQERLWQGLRDGEVSIVSTDTCSFTRKQKNAWKGDWTKLYMGMPGLETLLPVLYTRGVLDKRITLEQMVEKLAASPAKIMGMYPQKGAIAIGSDADLAIIHPKNKTRVDSKIMETNCDWNPYEGWELAGFARTTLSRGEVIVDDYKVAGAEGRGRFIPRKLG